jgi:hypothetical protein
VLAVPDDLLLVGGTMQFKFCPCEVCKQSVFREDKLVAYQIRDGLAVPMDLEGKQPWAGVRCVCRDCIRTLGEKIGMERTY